MIYYFTGTGNSLWAAKKLGEELKQPVESIIKHRAEEKTECSDKILGFVFPTYMMDLPWIAKEFLLKLTVSSDGYVFVVMTSNHGKSGRAFQSLDQALCLGGKKLSAGFDLQMPGNCLVSTEEENGERLQQAPARIKEIVRSVQTRTVNYKSKGRKPRKNFVSGSYFYGENSLRRLTRMKNFIISEKCNGCGLCASICPLSNIRISDGRAVHGHDCAACYACLHWCPKDAVWIDAPAVRHRPQYHHPDTTLQEIAGDYHDCLF